MEEQRQAGNAPEEEILEEQAIEQQLIPMLGDELAAAATASGTIYLTLPGMCKALSLDTAGQLQRIRRTKTLAKGLRLIPLETPRRGTQKMYCLRVFGLHTAQMVPSSDPRVQELADQIDALTEIANFLRSHMEGLTETAEYVKLQLEQAVRLLEALTDRQKTTEHLVARIDVHTKKLTPAHERAIQEMVERIVQAMKRHAPPGAPLAYAVVYGRFKTQFRLGRYWGNTTTFLFLMPRVLTSSNKLARSLR